jgi:hypothetical protein
MGSGVNHRGLQRALFRMQLDPGFAARLRARERDAEVSTRLGPLELEWLRAADPAALSADREGRRRAQLLRNVAGEFALCTAVARAPDWLDAFTASPHFHRAIARDESLPLAFAAYACERALHEPPTFASLVALESALVHARRAPDLGVDVPRGIVALAPNASLLELAEGTFAWAAALREALDLHAPLPPVPPPVERTAPCRALATREREHVLIHAGPAPSPFALRDARAERLEPSVAAFLRACASGADANARADFCRERAIDPADLEAVIADFAADGILIAGGD